LMGGQAVVDAGFATSIVESVEGEEEPENSILDKNEISAKIEEIKNKLKEVDNKEDLNKWVAKLNPENETKPPLADGNIIEEDFTNMKLEEFLNQNPEAKAKNDLMIKNAETEAVKNERARGMEILNLASGSISENVLNAFKEGMTAGEYAVNEIKVNNKAREEAPTQNLGKLDVKDQIPTSEKSEKAKETAIENSVDEFLEGAK
jgi:hypothetical protein